MDRLELLKTYSVRELTEELRRRIAELDEARALLGGTGRTTGTTPRNLKMSEAKALYWQEWHAYRGKNPDATVDQWREEKRRAAKKRVR